MSDPQDEATIPMQCPLCKHSFSATKAWVERRPTFRCPSCHDGRFVSRQVLGRIERLDAAIQRSRQRR